MARPRARRRVIRRLGALAAMVGVSAALAGCGFRLAGTASLPGEMARTYLDTIEPNSDFFESLREALRSRGLEVVDAASDAGARLMITEDNSGQRVLSVTARNIPREYEIFYAVTFALQAETGRLIEPVSLVATRNYTFDETQVLAKAREERVLRRALADDLARQVVRHIEAVAERGVTPVG
jgi:LPS-assembly lipoprotein